MYLKSYEALEPKDLMHLRTVLAEVCSEMKISIDDAQVQTIGHDLVGLWLSGFRSSEELKVMLKPLA
ncbi:hypothetical protein [Neorhizobium sp. NCHU2750]|uniref:hypothetical protein n=1 Tax=Neorhizobium sp. NCHU2750 TaxID=1825976 RepID=UPI000E73C2DE|nr:hypothetical protein NCHU2750_15480 [Neorhizobium sp. NCHU2750]